MLSLQDAHGIHKSNIFSAENTWTFNFSSSPSVFWAVAGKHRCIAALITIFQAPTQEDIGMWGRRLGLDPQDINDIIIFERKGARLVQNIVILLVTCLLWLFSSSRLDAQGGSSANSSSIEQQGADHSLISIK